MGLKNSQADNRYLEASILTATPEQLILKTFDGLIQFSKQGLLKLKELPRDIEAVHNYLRRSQNACSILMGAVDFENGGDVAPNIFALYMRWHRDLVAVNMQQNPDLLATLIEEFIDIRQTWVIVIENAREERMAEAAEEDAPLARIG